MNRSMDSLYTIQQGGEEEQSVWESYGTEGDVLLLFLELLLVLLKNRSF